MWAAQRLADTLRMENAGRVRESWEKFYPAQLKAIRAAHEGKGALHGPASVRNRLDLLRDYARGLARWGKY